jgi:hypothetical protein
MTSIPAIVLLILGDGCVPFSRPETLKDLGQTTGGKPTKLFPGDSSLIWERKRTFSRCAG